MAKCLYYCLISGVLFLTTTQKAIASHAAGGELVYEWISDSTYRFIFKFYRDCSGLPEPTYVEFCARNHCLTSSPILITTQLNKINKLPDGRTNGSSIPNSCPAYKTKCEDFSSSLPGYEEWWYVDTVKLHRRCNKWTFYVSVQGRNFANNIVQGQHFVITATLDNLNAPTNSSPYFTIKPVPYVCINKPFQFKNGATKTNGDSLAFEPRMPIVTFTCATPQIIATATFTPNTPTLNLSTNPFQTNNTFVFDSTTGDFSFTPTVLGPHTIAFVAKEYRNGKLIGSTTREVQIQVQNCNAPPLTNTIDTPTVTNALINQNGIEACIDKQIDFCFNIKSADTNRILFISDNHNIIFPNATVTYTNTTQDSVRGCVSWTPGIKDTGTKRFIVTIKDSTCKPPGFVITQVFIIPIRINSFSNPPTVTSPLNFCQNEIVGSLSATGTNLLWHNSASGGTTSTTAPIPNTSTLGQYLYYVSHVPNACTSARVPIQVNINPGPPINLITLKDTVCEDENVLVYNNASNNSTYVRSWDTDNGGNIIQGAGTDSILLSYKGAGMKEIKLTIATPACNVRKGIPVYVKHTPVSFFETPYNTCLGKEVTIVPLKEDNAFYYWNIQDQNNIDTIYRPLYYYKWYKTGDKKISLQVIGENGCIGNVYDTVIDVHDYPDINISGPDFNDVCYGKEFELSVQEGLRYKYEWTPPLQFISYNKNKATVRAEQTGFLYVKVSNFWDCASVDSFYIDASPCCDVIMPDAFSPNGNGLNDYYRPLKANRHKIISFTIRNRWGQTIYETRDISSGWDGRFKGEPQDLGTYYYYLKYFCDEGGEEHNKVGNFTLIR